MGFLILLLTLLMIGCRHTPQSTLERLDQADSIIEEDPASALTILESVDTASIHGRADRARYSLLYTMALDKNLIPLTDSTILRPALAYYLKHGTPDQRMRTRYYQGCGYMDRGDDTRAMECFLDAIADTTKVYKDSLGLALVYIAQGTTYARQYRISNMIELNEKALEIYKNRHDTLRIAQCMSRLMKGFNHNEDTTMLTRTLTEIQPYIDALPQLSDNILSSVINAASTTASGYYTERFMDSIKNDSNCHNNDVYLSLANWYQKINDLPKSDELLNKIAENDQPYDTIRWLHTKSQNLEKAGNYNDALTEYRKFSEASENMENKLLNDELFFTRRKFDIVQSHNNKIRKKDRVIGISTITMLCLIIVMLVMINTIKIHKRRNKIIELQIDNLQTNLELQQLETSNIIKDMELLNQRNSTLANDNSNLLEEKNHLNKSREQLREEYDKLRNNYTTVAHRYSKIKDYYDSIVEGIIKKEITGKKKYAQKFDSIKTKIVSHQASFMYEMKEYVSQVYPNFTLFINSRSLTDEEYNCVILLILGLSGREVEKYLGLRSYYHISSNIRKKIGMDDGNVYLNIYLRQLIEKLDSVSNFN